MKKNIEYKYKSSKGQVLVVTTVLFLLLSLVISLGVSSTIVRDTRIVRDFADSKRSYFLAESLSEDMLLRFLTGKSFSSEESLDIDGHTASAVITDIVGGKKVSTTGNVNNAIRNIETDLIIGTGVTFNFGVQTDEGGFHMKNSSSINGNLFSNGPITGQNSNIVRGDVISAGSGGFIDGINATGTAYAHSITDSDIEGDAYYDTSISGTSVGGTKYPGSPDQSTSSLPITDAKVDEWKTQAESGGTINCSDKYEVDSNLSIGPVKISCDLVISGDPIIDIGGHVWVEGNIEIKNGPTIRADSSLGNNSVAVIADDPSDSRNSGTIVIKNNTVFEGSGSDASYVLLLSQNNDSELGGSVPAIEFQNSASGDVLIYAGHGEINVKNSVDLREITGYRVELQNSSIVNYEAGLVNLLFTSGPGGGYTLNNWREVE